MYANFASETMIVLGILIAVLACGLLGAVASRRPT